MKVLVDVNLSPKWVRTLQSAGIDAVHWSQLGPGDTPDPEIMAFARSHNYIILTRDLDFGTMLASNQHDRPSVVLIRTKKASPALVGEQIIEVLRTMSTELEDGALITIDLKRTRLRILPIRG